MKNVMMIIFYHLMDVFNVDLIVNNNVLYVLKENVRFVLMVMK